MQAIRVVLDTNVALAVFAYVDPELTALSAAIREGRLQAVANAATRAEWLRVLWRGSLPFNSATRLQAASAFDAVVIDVPTYASDSRATVILPRCRDADDQIFLELARDASCSLLLSRDRELLKLSRQCLRSAGFSVCLPEVEF